MHSATYSPRKFNNHGKSSEQSGFPYKQQHLPPRTSPEGLTLQDVQLPGSPYLNRSKSRPRRQQDQLHKENRHGQTSTRTMMMKWKMRSMDQVTRIQLPFQGGVLMRVPVGTDGNSAAPIQVEPIMNHWQTIQARRRNRIQRGYQQHRGQGIGNQQGEQHNKIYEFIAGGKTRGHRPAPINEGLVYRHVGGNVNGVKPFWAQEELFTSVSKWRGLQSAGCSLIETNTEWDGKCINIGSTQNPYYVKHLVRYEPS
jgi:hypothetical protein